MLKTRQALILVATLVGGLAFAGTATKSLHETVEAQKEAIHAKTADSYLFEVRFSTGSDEHSSLGAIQSNHALLKDDTRYLTAVTTFDRGEESLYLGDHYYNIEPPGGAPPPPFHRPHIIPEPKVQHPAIENWSVELSEIRRAMRESGRPFGASNGVTVTTAGRLRHSGGALSKEKAKLVGLTENQAVISVVHAVKPLQYADYLLLDGSSGKVLAQGKFLVPRPPPPRP